MWKPNLGENHMLFFIVSWITISLSAPTSWFSSSYNYKEATTYRYLPAPTGWKHQLPGFLLAATIRRLQPPCLYQHQLDGSSNFLVFKHQPEGSYNNLSCTTLPPWIVDFFMLCFFLQCRCTSSLHFIWFLPRSFHCHCPGYLITILFQSLIIIIIYYITQSTIGSFVYV